MLYAFGCSFTYGTSCINPKTDSWPVLLADLLETSCTNYGLPGASNDHIFKTVLENLLKIDKNNDYIIVMMTSSSRRYFRKRNILPSTKADIAKTFYKYLHDEECDSINFLQNLNALHNILKGYRYLITFMDARPLLECKEYNLGAGVSTKENMYIPKRLGLHHYIEDIDNQHPSNKGHIAICNELYKGYFNE